MASSSLKKKTFTTFRIKLPALALALAQKQKIFSLREYRTYFHLGHGHAQGHGLEPSGERERKTLTEFNINLTKVVGEAGGVGTHAFGTLLPIGGANFTVIFIKLPSIEGA